MNDTIGLTYDDDAAVRFCATTTGLDESIVATVLRSKDLYLWGLGILPEDWGETLATTAAGERAKWPELFPSEHVEARYVDQPLQRAFIVRDCGVNEETVRTILRADEEYMRRRGIVD